MRSSTAQAFPVAILIGACLTSGCAFLPQGQVAQRPDTPRCDQSHGLSGLSVYVQSYRGTQVVTFAPSGTMRTPTRYWPRDAGLSWA
jgi:hypothetical protein